MFGLFIFLLFLAGIVGFFAYILRTDRPLLEHSLGHWHHTVAGLQGTASEFYAAVKEQVSQQEMPSVVMKVVAFHEAGIVSDKRDYLRVRRGEYSFDLCVAPFGNSLFVSSWLCEYPSNVRNFFSAVPFIGWFVRMAIRLFDPETYYKIDAAAMFQGAVHNCVLSVLDQMTTAQGLDPIPESARKPVMRELYGSKGNVNRT